MDLDALGLTDEVFGAQLRVDARPDEQAWHAVDGCEAPLDLDALGLGGWPCEALDLDHLLMRDVARPLRPQQHVAPGIAYKSSAYGRDIAKMRWQANEEQRARDESKKRVDARQAWDTLVARIGDSTCGNVKGHHNCNTWDFIGRDAFAQISKGTVSDGKSETSIGGTTHKCETLMTAAALVWSRLERAYHYFLTAMRDGSSKLTTAVVINRYSDSTPVMLRYGRLQGQLMEKARYVKELPPDRPDGCTRYTTCTWVEWKRLHPHARPQMGILELFGQSADISCLRSSSSCSDLLIHDGHGSLTEQSFIFPPCILERPTGDCTMTAHERAFISNKDIRKLGESAMVLVNDCPDNCRANLRFKRRMLDEVGSNVFYDELSGCVAHKLHTYSTKSLREEQLVGHIHAAQTILGISSRQKHLEDVFAKMVEAELEVIPGDPPAEYAPMLDMVLENTILRARNIVRARSGETEAEHHVILQERVKLLRRFCNGNIMRRRCQHYCNGCCLDEYGVYSRRLAVNNFTAAFVSAGIFTNLSTHAMKSRWLSSSGALAMLLCGMLLHGVLPRAWDIAWPKWHIDRCDADNDDFHRLVRSKVYRAKLWMCADNAVVKHLGLSIGISVADHCLQRLQHLDAKGGLLEKIASRSGCPLRACFSSCQQFLTSPLDTSAVMLKRLFENLGSDVVNVAFRIFFSVVLSFAGRLWFYLISMYESWPYKLVPLGNSTSSLDEALGLATELFEAKDCCLDRGIAMKVRDHVRDGAPLIGATVQRLAADLSGSAPLRRILWLWGKSAKLCNMHTERLLALYRLSCRKRCTIDRQICSGYLAQVRRLHLKAGGICSSKTTRSKLQAMGIEFVVSKRQRKLAKAKARKKKVDKPTWAMWCASHIVSKQVELERKLERGEYRALVKDLSEIWQDCSSRGVDPPRPARVARPKEQRKRAKHAVEKPYPEAIGTSLFGLSSSHHCIRPDVLRDEAQSIVESQGGEVHGLEIGWSNKFLAAHRQEFLSNAYVQDGDFS